MKSEYFDEIRDRGNKVSVAVAIRLYQHAFEQGDITRDEFIALMEEPRPELMVNAPGGAS